MGSRVVISRSPRARREAHLRPDPSCYLCRSTSAPARMETDEQRDQRLAWSATVWDTWAGDVRRGPARVRHLLTGGEGAELTLADVRRHFAQHGVLQPPPTTPMRRQESIRRIATLPPRHQALIDCLFRLRVLTTPQLVDLVGIPYGRSTPHLLLEELTLLAGQHYVYRYFPRRPTGHGRRGEPVWLMGRDAVGWVEQRHGRSVSRWQWTQRASDVGPSTLAHDLTVSAILARLAASARDGVVATDTDECQFWVHPGNVFGPRHATLAFTDPTTHLARHLMADAVCAVSTRVRGPRSALPVSSLLPFFLEYDRGSRLPAEVVDQLMSYHFLALSGAAGRRFPQMAVDRWAPPVVMVLKRAGRAHTLRTRLRALAAHLGIRNPLPIYLISEAEFFRADPWRDPMVMYAWDEQKDRRWPLATMLVRACAPLLHAGGPDGYSLLDVDLSAARPRTHQGGQ